MDDESTPTAPNLLRVLEDVLKYALYLPPAVKERAMDAIERAKGET